MPAKNIPANERLIVALDVETAADAQTLVTSLGDAVGFYKIGLELCMSGEYFPLLEWLKAQQKKVFCDLKFFDVPQTVASAVKQLSAHGCDLATIHGNQSIMEAAAAAKGDMKILAVTALTSLDQGDIEDLGFAASIPDVVLSRARRALETGVDGIVSSGLEVPMIRREVGEKLIVVAPGIRPVVNNDDQKRTVNVEQAFKNGADYIVVGRPVRDHHGFDTPLQAAQSIQNSITKVFG